MSSGLALGPPASTAAPNHGRAPRSPWPWRRSGTAPEGRRRPRASSPPRSGQRQAHRGGAGNRVHGRCPPLSANIGLA
eukprot:10938608-Alexandrium_andersonii.AAC.1